MAFPMDLKEKQRISPSYTPLPTSDTESVSSERPPRQTLRERFTFKRTLLTFLIFTVFFHVARRIKYHCQRGYSDADDYFAADSLNIFGEDRPKPSPHHHWKNNECVKWTNESSIENSTFAYTLPTTASHLKLISHGAFFGHVQYVLAEDDATDISVNITLKAPHGHKHPDGEVEREPPRWWKWIPGHGRWHHKKRAPVAIVCQLKNDEGEIYGVGVFRPRKHGWWKKHPKKSSHEPLKEFSEWPHPSLPHRGDDEPHHPHHPLPHPPVHKKGAWKSAIFTKVVVTIPKGELFIPALESVFPTLWTHVHPGVFNEVTFGAVGLVGGPVVVDAFTAAKAAIISRGFRTHPINGTFVVSDKLTIVTHNTSVTANVTLLNAIDAGTPTTLNINTDNGTIATTVALLVGESIESLSAEQVNGSFAISTVTKHADIITNVTYQPISSVLRLSSVTTNASASAFLPASYEGPFVLITNSDGESTVHLDEDTEDPSGAGRDRVLQKRSIVGRILSGSVAWVEKDDSAVAEDLVFELGEDESGEVISQEEINKFDEIERDLISRTASGCHRGHRGAPRHRLAAAGAAEDAALHHEKPGISLITSGGDATLFLA